MHDNLNALNAPPTNGWPRSKLLPLWIALGLWIFLVGLFFVLAMIVNSETWTHSLEHACSFWLLWIVFLPIIVLLSLRFPFEQPNVLFQIGVHLGACAAIVALSQIAYRTFLPLPPMPSSENKPVVVDSPASVRPIGSAGMRAAPDILIYLATVSACVAFAHFRRSQERERRAIELEARLAQAKLQTLRMQINPHFLFNTLNAISSLIHSNPHVADDMITDLSELLRVSLESSDEQEVQVSREMELLGYYLRIEQRRFGKRLEVEQHIAPEVLDALVPALILQPIVENAIRHGIEPQTGAGKINIHMQRHDTKIHLSVSNNGTVPIRKNRKPGGHGIGLSNTQARLQQLYGDAQSFSFGESESGGWEVKIEVPFRPASTKLATA